MQTGVRSTAGVLTALLASLAWLALDAHAQADVGLRVPLLAGESLTVPVTIDGHGPYSFLLDTGSSHTTVSVDLAARLGAPRVAKTRVSTASGDAWSAVVALGSVGLGPLVIPSVMATELPQASLSADGLIHGVVGLDVLGQRPFCLDYANRSIRWDAPVPSGGDVEVPLDTRGPVWLVAVDDESGRRWLVPDSGADGLTLFDRGQWRGVELKPGTVRVQTVTGAGVGTPAVLARLNLGRRGLVDLPVTVLDGTRVSAEHGDGLLPTGRFARACFDPQRGRARFTVQAASVPEPAALQFSRSSAE